MTLGNPNYERTQPRNSILLVWINYQKFRYSQNLWREFTDLFKSCRCSGKPSSTIYIKTKEFPLTKSINWINFTKTFKYL